MWCDFLLFIFEVQPKPMVAAPLSSDSEAKRASDLLTAQR